MGRWKCVKCHHEWDGTGMVCHECQGDGKLIGIIEPPSEHELANKIMIAQALRRLSGSTLH